MLTIPDELVRDILLRLPADVLYNVMRLVCKSWLNIINDPDFVSAHTHRSACTGFLCTASYGGQRFSGAYFVEVGNGKDNGLGIYHFRDRESMIGSCDGIVFFRKLIGMEEQFRLLNPVTRQVVTHHILIKPDLISHSSTGIEYARSSGKYKVVQAYLTADVPLPHKISILTLGVDNSWRRMKKEQINKIGAYIKHYCTLSVGGFIYWHGYRYPVVLALDVDDETIHQVRTPVPFINGKHYDREFIKSERFLVFVLVEDKNVFDFWALVNPKTGEWEKLYRVQLNGKQEGRSVWRLILSQSNNSCLLCLVPRVILNDDVVIFYVWEVDIYIGYEVKTGALFRCGKNQGVYHKLKVVHFHRQTLVQLK